jgi:hypothetical protein
MELTEKDFKYPSERLLQDMKAIHKVFHNPSCRAIIEYLLRYGYSSISDMAAMHDIDIPYRTLQTAQNHLMANGFVEYREQPVRIPRAPKPIWFTRKFRVMLDFLESYEETLNQYYNNQTPHSVEAKIFTE